MKMSFNLNSSMISIGKVNFQTVRSIKLTQDLTDDSILIIGIVPLNEHTH